jgi:hypothetical protein
LSEMTTCVAAAAFAMFPILSWVKPRLAAHSKLHNKWAIERVTMQALQQQ